MLRLILVIFLLFSVRPASAAQSIYSLPRKGGQAPREMIITISGNLIRYQEWFVEDEESRSRPVFTKPKDNVYGDFTFDLNDVDLNNCKLATKDDVLGFKLRTGPTIPFRDGTYTFNETSPAKWYSILFDNALRAAEFYALICTRSALATKPDATYSNPQHRKSEVVVTRQCQDGSPMPSNSVCPTISFPSAIDRANRNIEEKARADQRTRELMEERHRNQAEWAKENERENLELKNLRATQAAQYSASIQQLVNRGAAVQTELDIPALGWADAPRSLAAQLPAAATWLSNEAAEMTAGKAFESINDGAINRGLTHLVDGLLTSTSRIPDRGIFVRGLLTDWSVGKSVDWLQNQSIEAGAHRTGDPIEDQFARTFSAVQPHNIIFGLYNYMTKFNEEALTAISGGLGFITSSSP